ncbi:MAG: ADP-ribosyl-[dinitrogen reductase] hydrolase [Dechloromonas sp.]|uniref:ADP-ribosyl-[dinitrogen reductase] hydrolase n=1 Tax=Candidatus Dechloromonas phosphorivorans TaxID=2899244 RepID=A0A935K2M3_9RHOO|nr:ADP-ribosyl-[dinitrogen reductase] hydrolase [Candidatus Dechloromonas phosphorivorans]
MLWARELIARNAPVRNRPTPSPRECLLDKAKAAYLGLAIGDALGATVEFLTPNEIRHQIGIHSDITGGGWLRLKAGQVTDDTTMSLALGKSILTQGSVDAKAAAEAFDAWMRGKPVDIGNTVRRNLIQFRKTGNPAAPASEHDAGNGAAMRLLPIALACYGQPPETTIFSSRAQAHVTHNNALSDAACETLILMVQDLMSGHEAIDVERERAATLVQTPGFAYDKKRCDNPSGYIVDTIQAVFQSFFATENFEDCLMEVVNRGGDADTTGAIAGMLAGACYGMDSIPKRWLKALDEATSQKCTDQALALMTLAGH